MIIRISVGASLLAIKTVVIRQSNRLQGKLLHMQGSMHIHHHRLLHQQVHVAIVVEVEGLVGLAVDLCG